MNRLQNVYNASVGSTGMPLRVFVSLGLVTFLLMTMLVACGESSTPTPTPKAAATATKTTASSSTAAVASAAPSASASPSPSLPLPSNSARPSTSTSPSTGAVATDSDGGCPETHSVKAGQLGPMKTYAISGSSSYDTMRATECFATEADAQAAGYRKSNR